MKRGSPLRRSASVLEHSGLQQGQVVDCLASTCSGIAAPEDGRTPLNAEPNTVFRLLHPGKGRARRELRALPNLERQRDL